MKTDIRKISIGKNFPDGAMHYQVGSPVKLQSEPYTVARISVNKDLLKEGKTAYDVYLSNEHGVVLWKTIIDMSVIVENNINFD